MAPATDGIPTPPPLLRRLELGYNRMRGAAAAELARALPRCALTYIDLEANRFSAAEEVELKRLDRTYVDRPEKYGGNADH